MARIIRRSKPDDALSMSLEEYNKKRHFGRTPEPKGTLSRHSGQSFVIQKHKATRLHYDLRLEMEGVLRSWAVPKGPSLDPKEKRLAIQTEDHPIDYGSFEGIIPKGNYGAGAVIVWDAGTYEMVDPPTPEQGWTARKFHVRLKGNKLDGEWVLVETEPAQRQWLLFKVRDRFASNRDITRSRPESTLSGRTLEEVGESSGNRHWYPPTERTLEALGVKRLSKSKPPERVTPMLAAPVNDAFDDDGWLFEIKFDGVRAIAFKNGQRVRLRTRQQNSIGGRFPALLDSIRSLPVDSLVIDGEIVVFDREGRSRFDLLQPRLYQTRASHAKTGESTTPAFYCVFDVLHVAGYSVVELGLEDRKEILKTLVPEGDGLLRYVDHVEGSGRAFFRAAVSHGLEGIVAKRRDSTYRQSRSRQWLKIKAHHSKEFVVVGFTPPSESRKHFGSLLLGLYDAEGHVVYVGRVGSGFDRHTLRTTHSKLKARRRKKASLERVPPMLAGATWVKPDLVCEVRFNEWTAAGRLRAPVFVRFREDVEPKQCRVRMDTPAQDPEGPARGASACRDSGVAATKVRLTNLPKVFWPDDGLTKGDLIRYYSDIAEVLVPYLKKRPLVLKRYPNGIAGDHFYQKDAPDHTPSWVKTRKLRSEDMDKQIRYFVGADRETLIYLANLGNITQNPWSSRLGSLEYPDYLIFDLDPGQGVPFSRVQTVALELGKVLEELRLRGYPKTSGASGIHVYLPLLARRFTYREARSFALAVASVVVKRLPDLATTERSLDRRPRGVYVDCLQNVRGKTVASVYSPRAQPRAPVSTPLEWDELRRRIDPGKFTMKSIFGRLESVGDLFAPVLTDGQDISPFLEALVKL